MHGLGKEKWKEGMYKGNERNATEIRTSRPAKRLERGRKKSIVSAFVTVDVWPKSCVIHRNEGVRRKGHHVNRLELGMTTLMYF